MVNENLPVAAKAKEALQKKNGNGNGKTAVTAKNLMGLKSNQVSELFSLYRSQIAAVVPSVITPDRLIQVATSLVTRNPEIAACTTGSIIGALLQSAILGLDMTPSLQYVYFIPYNNSKIGMKEVQFQIGYRGLLELLRRSGQVETAYSYVVYDNDKFDFELGLFPRIVHVPAKRDRGELCYVYAVIKFKDGGYIFEVMSKQDVEHVRSRSKTYMKDITPWKTDPAEMWRKTVLKRLCKYAPVSIESTTLAQQLSADEGIINADKIDLTTKELPIEHVDYTDVTDGQVEPEPEQQQQTAPEPVVAAPKQAENKEQSGTQKPGEPTGVKSPKDDFLKAVENLQTSIKKITKTDDIYFKVLGNFGVESPVEIPERGYNPLITALSQELVNLKK